jgi:indolepyruvate ferredoxin oxidoreductase alpha subunit
VEDPFDLVGFEKAVKEELAADEPSVIIAQRPCALLKGVKYSGFCTVDTDACRGCKMCMKLGCPAISFRDGKAVIDTNQCNGCSLCTSVCPFKAIRKEEK